MIRFASTLPSWNSPTGRTSRSPTRRPAWGPGVLAAIASVRWCGDKAEAALESGLVTRHVAGPARSPSGSTRGQHPCRLCLRPPRPRSPVPPPSTTDLPDLPARGLAEGVVEVGGLGEGALHQVAVHLQGHVRICMPCDTHQVRLRSRSSARQPARARPIRPARPRRQPFVRWRPSISGDAWGSQILRR